jgi:hypothetical protein
MDDIYRLNQVGLDLLNKIFETWPLFAALSATDAQIAILNVNHVLCVAVFHSQVFECVLSLDAVNRLFDLLMGTQSLVLATYHFEH